MPHVSDVDYFKILSTHVQNTFVSNVFYISKVKNLTLQLESHIAT